MYFDKLPFIPYPINGSYRVLRDITLNIRFKKEIIEDASVYAEYDIENNETPEIIAEKLYGSADLYWVIMLFNQRYHYAEDFPMQDWVLDEYIQRKYGAGNQNEQHILRGQLHFETPDGHIVDGDFPRAQAITNYQYEYELNESKRRIKILDPALINQLVQEAETIYND